MCACSNHLKVNAGKHFQKTDMSVFRHQESFIQMKEISCACGKTTGFFLCFLHLYSFLFIPGFWCLILFFSASFLCFPSGIQKLAKINTFKCNLLHKKPSLSNFQFGFPVVIYPRMIRMNSFKWTVVYTISLHSLTEQSKGLLFSLLDLTNLPPIESFLMSENLEH